VLPLMLAVVLPVAAVAAAWFLLADDGGVVGGESAGHASVTPATKAAPPASTPATPGTPNAVELERPDVFAMHFKHPPKGAIVFDVRSGRVLWRHNPLEPMPIASITTRSSRCRSRASPS
jgi:D-alanyl-D-alanine carboxypeptidase (penicillin-binding protein 5/6)